MNRKSIKILIRISIITTCFIIILNIVWASFSSYLWEDNSKPAIEENKYVFKSADWNNLWVVALAISTNIWIWFKQRTETPVNSYKDMKEISNFIWNPEAILSEIVETNMITIKDYLNFVKIDVKKLIDSSNNKKDSLENIISGLETRYKSATKNSSILSNYWVNLSQNMANITNDIETLKTKMDTDAKAFDSISSIENIKKYGELKKDFNDNKVKIVYINHFLKQYTFLNSYTKVLLDTLINNKEAIINSWYVVTPDSWNNFIKKFDLIYTEEEWKNEIKKEEE